jgi:hypothetical protein
LPGRARSSAAPVGLAAFAAGLALYVATAKPDLVGGDPGEFQLVPPLLGIAHHTGYPLYTLLGWLWAQLPLGSIAYRLNLFSALWGAAAVGLGAALATRLAAGAPLPWLAGLVAAAALAVAPLPWHWATIAGVRSGAVAEVGWLMVAAVGVLVALGQRGPGAPPPSGRPHPVPLPGREGTLEGRLGGDGSGDGARRCAGRAIAWLGLAVGVALAHHRSGALALPGIALALASAPALWRLPWRAWLLGLALGLLPLLSYAYLPLRARQGTPFHQWHPETWEGFVDLALAVEHSRVHFAFPLEAMPGRALLLAQHLRGEFGALGLAVAALGGAWLLARWPRAFLVLAAYLAAQSWQVLNWDVGKDQLNVVYQLPAHLIVATWIGLGAAALGWLAARLPLRGVGPLVAGLAAAALLVWVALRAGRELDAQRARAIQPVNHDRSQLAAGFQARRLVAGGLARVEPNAVVVGDWEQATVVWYLQLVEGAKPDVQVNYPVTNLPAALDDYPDRPIWLMARTAVPPDRRLSADGPFVRVAAGDRPSAAPPPDARPIGARFEDALELVGLRYGDRLGRSVAAPDPDGDVLPLTLYWRALGAARRDLSVSVRLIGADGRIAAQQDNAAPVLSLYPTSRWREGEVVGDYYELPYRALAPGEYRLELRVYQVDAAGFRDLRVGAADHAVAGEVTR